jgi:hypothetical protein
MSSRGIECHHEEQQHNKEEQEHEEHIVMNENRHCVVVKLAITIAIATNLQTIEEEKINSSSTMRKNKARPKGTIGSRSRP